MLRNVRWSLSGLLSAMLCRCHASLGEFMPPRMRFGDLQQLIQAENAGPLFIHQFDDTAAAAGYASQWVVGDDNRQAGFFHQ